MSEATKPVVAHQVVGWTMSDDKKVGTQTCVCGVKLTFDASGPKAFSIALEIPYNGPSCPLMIGFFVTQLISAHVADTSTPT